MMLDARCWMLDPPTHPQGRFGLVALIEESQTEASWDGLDS